MDKFSWHQGETRTLGVLPEDANGVSTAASYQRAQMRILVPGNCVIIEGVTVHLNDGTVHGAGYQFELNDIVLEVALRGIYDFAIWLQSTSGWECVSDDFKIKILRTC